MERTKYKEYEIQLEAGDQLFLYTDGIPEATNADNQMFRCERMLAALNQKPDADPKTLLENVRAAVDAFVQEAEQFDDLTMLSITYRGSAEPEN
jgi:sigma-B regulation protein RsbU (phosphoserine phosphatase)